jgi:hypothetical protein
MRVTLASSSPSAFFRAGTTVTIPAGATSSTFGITTTAVAAATTSEITATLGDVVQTAQLELVPSFTLESLAISPATQYANLTSTGVVTLSGPAASNTTVSLTSANPALVSVPASVAVPAGSLTATFPIAVKAVTANSAVTVTATYEGVSKTAVINVLTAADRVAISKAIYTAKNAQVKVEATSTSATATLTVYNASTGAQIGVLNNNGSGKYDGTLSVLFSGSNQRLR